LLITQNTIGLGLVAALSAGLIVAFYRTERHFREARIHRQMKHDLLTKDQKIPRWLIELYEATFRPDK
jgi:hypothetical protein